MSEPIYVDTDPMRKATKALDDLVSFLGDLFETLMRRQMAEGKCWGTCEIGQGFGTSYEPKATQLSAMPLEVGKVLVSGRLKLDGISTGYETVDQAANNTADQLVSALKTDNAPAPATYTKK